MNYLINCKNILKKEKKQLAFSLVLFQKQPMRKMMETGGWR